MEISGGNIRNIALNAAFLAAGERTSIRMEHVLHAARREYAKIDKLLTEAEFGPHLQVDEDMSDRAHVIDIDRIVLTGVDQRHPAG